MQHNSKKNCRYFFLFYLFFDPKRMRQQKLSTFFQGGVQVEVNFEQSTEGLPIFKVSDSKSWNKAIKELHEEDEMKDWLKNNKDIVEERFPLWLIARLFGSKGIVFQHVVIEFFETYLKKFGLDVGNNVELTETRQSNGKFDATLKGKKSTLDRFCEQVKITHKSPTCMTIEVKCIQVNANGKRKRGSKGSHVDIQRLKPDNFEILILCTHFKDRMNVYIANSDDLDYTSNGKSEDRGKRKKITTNIPLTNEEEALENIESQILKYMRKMFVIELK